MDANGGGGGGGDGNGAIVNDDEDESMFSPQQIALNKRMIREFYEANTQIALPLIIVSYLVVLYVFSYFFPTLCYLYINSVNLVLYISSIHKRFPKYRELVIGLIIINCSLSTLQQLASYPYTLIYFVQLFSTLVFINE